MRFFSVLAVFILLAAALPAKPAQALDWPWNWGWPWEWDWAWFGDDDPAYGHYHPHLEGPKVPHNVQWADDADDWRPQEWIDAKGSAKAVMDGLYSARIVTDQYESGGVPVLEVGQGFMDLSGRDKRRVAAFIDYAFGITKNTEAGVFYIYHFADDENPVGIYGHGGLQLQ